MNRTFTYTFVYIYYFECLSDLTLNKQAICFKINTKEFEFLHGFLIIINAIFRHIFIKELILDQFPFKIAKLTVTILILNYITLNL